MKQNSTTRLGLDNNIIGLGLDNGNGTVIGSARNNGVTHNVYFPAVYNTGDKRIDIKGNEIEVPVVPEYNGNCADFSFSIKEREGGNLQKVYIGQSAYGVDGVPKRNIGPGRHANTKFMRIMIYGALKGLLEAGMYADKNNVNQVNLCAGLPPEWFYVNKARRMKFRQNYAEIVKAPFKIAGIEFNVQPNFMFMGEGLGAYYDFIYDDAHNLIDGYDNRDGVLIIDAGQSTLDTAIITGGVMRKEDIITNSQYGIQSFYNEVVSELGRAGVAGVKVTDVEQYHYTKTTHISGLEKVYQDCFNAALDTYLVNFVSYINQIYSSRTNQFAASLLVGGITKTCNEADCTDNLLSDLESALDDTPVEVADSYANANGYRKGIEGYLISEGLIEKNWG